MATQGQRLVDGSGSSVSAYHLNYGTPRLEVRMVFEEGFGPLWRHDSYVSSLSFTSARKGMVGHK